MTAVAIILYALGVIGAATAVWRDVAPGPREWVIIIIWPLAVAYAVATVPFNRARR